MSSPIIQPLPPRDGRDYACQCARCGSSCDYYHCEYCDGDGFVENDEPDPECDEAFIDCPDCGGKLTSKEYHEYHCDACGRTVWYKNKHYYRIVENLGTQFVQKISDDGKSLAGSWPLMKAVELMTCDECRKVVIDFTTRYEANTNTTRVVCKRCVSKGF